MSESSETPEPVEQPQPTPVELAKSWLDFRKTEVSKDIENSEHSLKHTKTFQPTRPGPHPGPEAGGMDIEDWRVADIEYRNWPEEREEAIDYLEDKLDRLERERDDIWSDGVSIDDGDEELVEKFAALERERREKLRVRKERSEKAKRIVEEASQPDNQATPPAEHTIPEVSNPEKSPKTE